MADEHYKWLDREAAERLLRGEPLEAVDADARAAADRLTAALDALTPGMPSEDVELPGEEAALAAFRKARGERDNEDLTLSTGARAQVTARSADAGLVRLGLPGPEGRRARWGRPVRFGMAATLAAGMLGGVAVAAAAGVLPTPFRDDRPEPASTVSAPVTPDLPLMSPSPEGTAKPPAGGSSPDGGAGGADDGSAREDTARGGGATGQPDDSKDSRGSKGSSDSKKDWRGSGNGWRGGVLAACRDVRDGRKLDSDRRRGLEGAAGGKGKVNKYCKGVLGNQGDRRATGTDTPGNGDTGSGRGNGGKGKGKGKGGNDEGGKGKDKGGRGRGGRDGGSGVLPGGNGHQGNGHRGNGGSVNLVSTPHGAGPSGSGPSGSAPGASLGLSVR
ncbi:hypothetical protein [Streptomyces sp. NPDC046862]|uniref:hypothetical protein n=1 Tax=Streptomyces sp. NPDC046862 TaxID=3154603 RepID=UPI00345412B6